MIYPPSMKHICFHAVHPMYNSGGSGNQTWITALGFLKAGWRVSFLTPDMGKIVYNYPNGDIQIIKYPLYFKITRGFTLPFLSWIINLWVVYRIVKGIDADIYYQGNLDPYLGLLVLFCKRNKRLLMMIVAQNDSHLPRIWFRKAYAEVRYKYSFLIRWYPYLRFSFHQLLLEYGLKRTGIIIAQNESQKDGVKEYWKRDAPVLHNPWIPLLHEIPKKEDIIVWVGVCRDIKSPEVFCRIAGRLSNLNARFLLIGSQYEIKEKADNLSRLMKENGVEYIGNVPLLEAEEWIAKAKVIVNTSESEGFPNTFIQAWLYNTLVVSMNADPDGLLSKQGFGFLGRTEDSLSGLVEEAFTKYSSYNSITERARKFIIEDSGLSSFVKRIEEIIDCHCNG